MVLRPKEFLDHRFIFIKDYPDSPFVVGEILSGYESDGKIYLHQKAKLEPKQFLDNFSKLRWWEHRTIEQLKSIKYAKVVSGSNYYVVGDIVEVTEFYFNNAALVGGRNNILFNLKGHHFLASQLEPTTKEEHDKFWENNNKRLTE